MNRQSVVSSNVKEVGWQPDEDAGSDEQQGKNGTLEVEFHSGHVYQYFDVPEQVFRSLVTADSPGRALNRDIVGRYAEERVS